MADYLAPLRADYDGNSPDLKGAPAFAGEGAVVLGRTTLGAAAWLGAWSVIRADGHYVRIGEDFHLGEHATVHIAHDIYPTHIGDRVTAGKGAVIHACTLGDGCVVEREAVILDGSRIGAGAVISAGSVVFPRSELEGGWLYSGSPAKPVARVSPPELEGFHQKIRNAGAKDDPGDHWPQPRLDCFVAPSARVRGTVSVGEGVGVWYGCRLDAGAHRIVIGDGTNVQDNSILSCDAADILVGPDVTIGHNVTISDCNIGSSSLIGIGSLIAPGTIVESEVLVAAGTHTEPGQRLTAGQVWAGRPARPIAQMDEHKRKMTADILSVYRNYADSFRASPHRPLTQPAED
ncbi:Carbonic anhydrase or acetyltransferase, isoleucine patch superfamily [Rhodovulum sp. ES.010]|uniref:gamma carbonic anhydrase family protein n=1 Tax=Rhodovulum sp. ES.010 TaxID=1882821 RepID=UPI00092694C4|nr:gamma carbonic anhydrase family protein [Rhodovulum sp. ES.010]SIO34401.1 Carbonic anhydrase or acetyltransferase, isoleucine patch superfamily [Rhodovulum sp. ES.010]